MIFPYLDNEPIVPLEIKSKNGEWIEFHAYIDSGAAVSVFHSDHAELLGLTIQKGRKIFLTVGNEEEIPAYVHKIPVRFAGKEFFAEVSFSRSLELELIFWVWHLFLTISQSVFIMERNMLRLINWIKAFLLLAAF